MNLGATFIPVATARQGHLHVVVSEPDNAGQIAVVNLTSRRWDSDTCCVIESGEHRWVTHETVVAYSHARVVLAQDLARGVEGRVLRLHDGVEAELLARIQHGALDCEQTPPLVAAAIRSTLGL